MRFAPAYLAAFVSFVVTIPAFAQRTASTAARFSTRRRLFLCFLSLACLTILLQSPAAAQGYLSRIGRPDFTPREPVELGFIDVSNGNLHLEIPLAALPQRGSVHFSLKLVYDSRVWSASTATSQWSPNVLGPNTQRAGWRVVTNADASVSRDVNAYDCGDPYTGQYTQYGPFYFWDANGTQRTFAIDTTDGRCNSGPTSGSAYATDGSGYYMSVSYSSPVVSAPDGKGVYPQESDANGNYFSMNSAVDEISGVSTDTLGRQPYTKTVVGNVEYYDVLNSQGSVSRFVVTWTPIPVSTNFSSSYALEYSGTVRVVQSVVLPSGVGYNFTYDSGTNPGNYGLLKNLTLPTGGQVTYTYVNFDDAYSPCDPNYFGIRRNRWVYSRTIGGNTWAYAPQVLARFMHEE